MRFLMIILILLILPTGFTRSQDQPFPGQQSFEETPPGEIIEGEDEGTVGEDFQSLEPDIFLRNL